MKKPEAGGERTLLGSLISNAIADETRRDFAIKILPYFFIGFNSHPQFFLAHFPSLIKLFVELKKGKDISSLVSFSIMMKIGMDVHSGHPDHYMNLSTIIDEIFETNSKVEEVSSF